MKKFDTIPVKGVDKYGRLFNTEGVLVYDTEMISDRKLILYSTSNGMFNILDLLTGMKLNNRGYSMQEIFNVTKKALSNKELRKRMSNLPITNVIYIYNTGEEFELMTTIEIDGSNFLIIEKSISDYKLKYNYSTIELNDVGE